MYQIRVINKDDSINLFYKTCSYDRVLNTFVKEVMKQKENVLLKNEIVKVQIIDEERIWLEHQIRGTEKEK